MSAGPSLPSLALAAAVVGAVVWSARRKSAAAQTRADEATQRADEAALRADEAAQQETARVARHAAAIRDARAAEDGQRARIQAEAQALGRSMGAFDRDLAALNPGGAATAARMHRFDPIFARLGRGIPVPYLRALAQAESGMNPHDPKGLINVVAIAVADYNRRHPGASITKAQLRDPVVSVTVAVDILRTIIASYATNHPSVANLREDWRNPHFVALLTAGWNAGFSQRAGVGRVVRHLLVSGVTDITVDRVFAAAPAAGAASTLSNPAKLAFAHKVTAAYVQEARG